MKDVSNQQIAEHLKRLNTWWEDGGADEATQALRPRACLEPVRRLLQDPNLRRAVVLLGPRRVRCTRSASMKGAQLNYARWGADHCEVDMVELSPALVPTSALEIKWSDQYVQRPEGLEGLMRFARKNHLAQVWATTRSAFGKRTVDGTEIRQWPAAVLAFHYGVRAVRGRLAGHSAAIKGIEA
ncbi:MAG: hypothetical protein LT106_21475 [Burkholderiaceae bacterium]|nr:hypothetical protein [Burkholderiaceae bacterium]